MYGRMNLMTFPHLQNQEKVESGMLDNNVNIGFFFVQGTMMSKYPVIQFFHFLV